MKTSEAFQIETDVWKIDGTEIKYLGWKKTWLNPNKRATELYVTFCVIWGYHVQNSTTQTLLKIET